MATKKTKATKTVTPSLGIKPIKSNIILEAVKKDTVSKGGIVLASVDAEAVSKGKILAVGPDVTLVNVGQTVLPNWQKAKKVKYETLEYWIVHEDDLVLVFEGE
jgi:chaperonin GroES